MNAADTQELIDTLKAMTDATVIIERRVRALEMTIVQHHPELLENLNALLVGDKLKEQGTN